MAQNRPMLAGHSKTLAFGVLLVTAHLAACVGNNSSTAAGSAPPPVVNTMTVTVDSGPAAASGAINHAYVTVKVCAPGSTTKCATIDHVWLDTGSSGLRLVGSVLAAASVTLAAETDSQGGAIVECEAFAGGQTWGPVALADITLAGEVAAKVPVQVLDDTNSSAPPPATCGANGTLTNTVASLYANGLLGVGVAAHDCGTLCVGAAPPQPIYYGCTAAGACTAENVALSEQVTNPVTLFASDNNGTIVAMANLINANGDASVQGELTFGISTQADNTMPATGLTVLGTDANGYFTAAYNGNAAVLTATIDSGTDSYTFNDPNMAVCSGTPPFTGTSFVGYYCPAVAPQSVFTVNSGSGTNNAVGTVDFAVADPHTFVTNASAFANLAGGAGSTKFIWGMPFFYGRKIYIAIDQHAAGTYTGPFYAY